MFSFRVLHVEHLETVDVHSAFVLRLGKFLGDVHRAHIRLRLFCFELHYAGFTGEDDGQLLLVVHHGGAAVHALCVSGRFALLGGRHVRFGGARRVHRLRLVPGQVRRRQVLVSIQLRFNLHEFLLGSEVALLRTRISIELLFIARVDKFHDVLVGAYLLTGLLVGELSFEIFLLRTLRVLSNHLPK